MNLWNRGEIQPIRCSINSALESGEKSKKGKWALALNKLPFIKKTLGLEGKVSQLKKLARI
jgi:hypothetical protein